MKNKLSFIALLLILSFTSKVAKADYISKAVTGNYENSNVWNPRNWGTPNPSGTSSPDDKIVIVANADITRNGNLSPVQVDAFGKFTVLGNVTINSWSGIVVKSGGEVHIYGNLSGSSGITVEKNGVLIVHGNLASTGSSVSISGNLIVKGNFSTGSSTQINNDGKLVVGGDFAHSGGGMSGASDSKLYILNPDANVTGPGNWGPIHSGDFGNLDDFIENESENPILWDIVEDVLPEYVGPSVNIWTGAQDSDWFNPDNWSKGQVPDEDSKIKVEAGASNKLNIYPNEDKSITKISSIEVSTGGEILVHPGSKLTVYDKLEIKSDGALKLISKYGSSGVASLIIDGEIIGNVDVEITLPANAWYYLSTPAINPMSNYYGSDVNNAYVYDYKNNQWTQNYDFSIAEGGLAYFESADNEEITISYSSELNNQDYKKEFESKGYYLFGNPYSSSINWDNLEKEKISSTMWYRTHIGEELAFVTYNSNAPGYASHTILPDGMSNSDDLKLIPPYQGVWVYTKTATKAEPASINITKDARAHSAEKTILKSSSLNKKADIIRVIAENNKSRDGAVIYFSENATDSGDDAGDSPKYFNSSVNIPEIYTRAGNNSLAINGLAPFEGECQMQLSVRNRTDDEVELTFDLSNYNEDDNIVLHDNYLDKKVNLRTKNQYTYKPFSLGDDHNRFSILFNPEDYEDYEDYDNIPTDIINQVDNKYIDIVVNEDNIVVLVDNKLLEKEIAKIEIFSIEGIKLNEIKTKTNITNVNLPNEKGAYIIVVNASNERKVIKVLN